MEAARSERLDLAGRFVPPRVGFEPTVGGRAEMLNIKRLDLASPTKTDPDVIFRIGKQLRARGA